MNKILVEKNEEDELPIPHVWRQKFKAIVSAFVKHDYKLTDGIENVNAVTDSTAKQIKEYIEDYGEELIELPEETWNTSIYISHGDHWKVLIDLFTKEEGLSDLVLNSEVRENESGYECKINLVYVP